MNAFVRYFLILTCLSAASAVQADFSKYQVILDRKPFGEIKIEPKPVADPKNSFAKHLEIRSIIDDGKELRVSFFDSRLNESFRMRVNETYNGIVLVSADYYTEEAVLRKGLEICKFSLKDEKTTSIAPPNQAPAARPDISGQPRHLSPDPNRSNPLAQRKAIRQPISRGETIENFLKNNPEAATKFPSPIRPQAPGENQTWPPPAAVGRGETIEKFLRENPDAIKQYPSPIRPPESGATAEGRGETIETMMMNQQQTVPAFQSPETMQLTDEYGNIVEPSGVLQDGTPFYDFPVEE